MQRALLTLSVIVITSSALRAADPPKRVIDMHLHVYQSDQRWEQRTPNPATGEPLTAVTEAAHREAVLAQMKKYNVVRAVISNRPEAVRSWMTADAGRFIPGVGFDSPKEVSVEWIRAEHAAGRLKVLGEIGLAYAGLSPQDAALEPYFALAEELDLPVALHMGTSGGLASYNCCPNYRMALNDPLLLEDVLLRHPKLRIYVMHAGWPFSERMLALMAAHPRVYIDVGVISWVRPRADFHDYLQKFVRAGYTKRILFGSDAMVWPEAIGAAIEAVQSAPFLSPGDKDDIFYNNAVRFLKLQ